MRAIWAALCPVSSNLMIFSKALVAFVWVVLSVLICALLMIAFVSIFADPSEMLRAIGQLIGSYTLARQAIVFFLVIGVLESLYLLPASTLPSPCPIPRPFRSWESAAQWLFILSTIQ